jgi:hypothetical protein
MIEREDDFGGVEHAAASHGVEVIEGHRSRAVSAKGAIDAADHNLAGASGAARLGREKLLADGLPGHCYRIATRPRNL